MILFVSGSVQENPFVAGLHPNLILVAGDPSTTHNASAKYAHLQPHLRQKYMERDEGRTEIQRPKIVQQRIMADRGKKPSRPHTCPASSRSAHRNNGILSKAETIQACILLYLLAVA